MRSHLILITLFCLISQLYAQSPEDKVAAFDRYVDQACKQWKVPGLAISVVKDGQLIFSKGYGVRQLQIGAAVDDQTLFCIGSTTKAITAAAMGMLADEGKVDWDDPVCEHLPDFQLYDPYVTRNIRIRDLFTHNAGLGNADFLWAFNDLTADEVLYQMRFSKPAYPFRGGYTYQNIMYLAAGKIIEKLSGTSWEHFVRKRIFQPLGMDRTVPLLKDALQQSNISVPHHYVGDKIVPIEDVSADVIAPAGAIWSSVSDMSKWMRFMLDSARVNGHPLLRPETYAELLRPQVIVPRESFYPTTSLTKPHWTTYALAWFQHDYNGRFVSFHTGSLPGTIAIIGLIPDENIGVYVLGNLDHAEVRHALMYRAFDTFGDSDSGRDWSTEMHQLYQGIRDANKANLDRLLSQKIKGTNPSLPTEAYAGTYYDQYYGTMVVEQLDGRLVLKSSSKSQSTLTHWHYDTFLATSSLPWASPSLIKFELSAAGAVQKLNIGSLSFIKQTTGK